MKPAQLEFFEKAVQNNPIKAAYEEAIALKKQQKAEDTNKKRAAEKAAKEDAADDEAAASKKRPGRPKGSRSGGGESASKRSRTKSTTTATPGNSRSGSGDDVFLVPTAITDVKVDRNDLDNSTASVSYNAKGLRFGDLATDSLERRAFAWTILSELVSGANGLGVKPTRDAETLLRTAAAELVDSGPMEIGEDDLAQAEADSDEVAEGDEGFAKGGDDPEEGEADGDYPEEEEDGGDDE